MEKKSEKKLTNKKELVFAKAYDSPTMQILLIKETDVIRMSPEVGGEWPWGESQTINFS